MATNLSLQAGALRSPLSRYFDEEFTWLWPRVEVVDRIRRRNNADSEAMAVMFQPPNADMVKGFTNERIERVKHR